jgi:hypothetical protein
VPGAGEMIAAECGGHDYTDPGTPSIAWDNAAARDAPVTALISDANVVLHAFAAVSLRRAAAGVGAAAVGGRSERGTRRQARISPTGGGGSHETSQPTG